ncbi:MAG: class I tRNA ligase family protein, partial [Patescibacteria group bacterium]
IFNFKDQSTGTVRFKLGVNSEKEIDKMCHEFFHKKKAGPEWKAKNVWKSLSQAEGGFYGKLIIHSHEGKIENSGKFDGMDSEKAKREITKFVGGERKIQYRLRDWLISRQRYWGPPIPMIFCENCKKSLGDLKSQKSNFKSFSKGELENPGWIAVDEKNLPVELPYIENFRPTGTGKSPLASHKEFYEVKCPRCGSEARRETDVSDTFLDSAWYYLAYLTLGTENLKLKTKKPKKEIEKLIPDKNVIKEWLPVDMYIGGAEHSVLHLLYVRFLALALHDLKLLALGESSAPIGEPFPKFRAHGLLIKDGAKMSKSKGNVVNPDEYIKNFGADVLRMYLMFIAPFEQGGDFRDSGLLGIERFLKKIRFYVVEWKEFWDNLIKAKPNNIVSYNQSSSDKDFLAKIHRTIKKITDDIEALKFNTAISALMIFLNEVRSDHVPDHGFPNTSVISVKTLTRPELETFLKLLAPFAPHMAEEIWRNVLGNETSIHREAWPEFDEKLIQEEKFTLVIQVNGKVRDSVEASIGIHEEQALALALRMERIMTIMGSQKPKRVIYVQDKLINLVL